MSLCQNEPHGLDRLAKKTPHSHFQKRRVNRAAARVVSRQSFLEVCLRFKAAWLLCDVRFTPNSRHCRAALGCPLSAKSGHRQAAEVVAEAAPTPEVERAKFLPVVFDDYAT